MTQVLSEFHLPQDFRHPSTFHRDMEGDYERVLYGEDSSIRIWTNREPAPFPFHWHPAVEIILPVEDTYQVVSKNRVYDLEVGDILLIPPGELHELHAPSSGTRLIFLLDISVISKLRGFASILPALSAPLLITPENNALYEVEKKLLLKIYEEYLSNNSFRELVIYGDLLNFFVQIGRSHIETGISSSVKFSKQREYVEKFNIVFDYIDTHYMEDLTLDTVADASGFSKYHFSRLFKQYTDSTFYDYLCRKRIRVAEDLLANPDLSVTEIALQSGFSSISTFNRIFKSIKNCTPTEYRDLYTRPHGTGYKSSKTRK